MYLIHLLVPKKLWLETCSLLNCYHWKSKEKIWPFRWILGFESLQFHSHPHSNQEMNRLHPNRYAVQNYRNTNPPANNSNSSLGLKCKKCASFLKDHNKSWALSSIVIQKFCSVLSFFCWQGLSWRSFQMKKNHENNFFIFSWFDNGKDSLVGLTDDTAQHWWTISCARPTTTILESCLYYWRERDLKNYHQ